jgi:hypothetical protein
MFASLVLTSEADHEWLERSFAMYKDIIEESWLYQKNLQKGVEKERQETLQRVRQILLTIVQGRFPEMTDLMRTRAETIEDPDVLQDLIVKISLAHDIQEALQVLVALGKNDKQN